MSVLRIGIISEHHKNDGEPIATLLQRYFHEKTTLLQRYSRENVKFEQLCSRYRSDRLDTKECFIDLKAQCSAFNPDIIIFVRDLDSERKRETRATYFEKCTACAYIKQQIHLLFVYEIEALILADLDVTTQFYHLKKPLQLAKSLVKETNPKGFLKAAIWEATERKMEYSESDMRELATVLDLELLEKNYPIWSDFIANFDGIL